MGMKVFVLGLPGSGKSTASRHIESLAQNYHWHPHHFNDYELLYDMYQEDCGEKFSCTDHDGFDIHDHKMFDVALQRLEQKVHHELQAASQQELAIIEFSRNDYQWAFKLFTPDFLRDAFFLFIDADIKTCIERIRKRSANPEYPDDHFVSEYIFESYYFKDDRSAALTLLQDFYCINEGATTVIFNPVQKSRQVFCDEVQTWVTPILQKKISAQQGVRV